MAAQSEKGKFSISPPEVSPMTSISESSSKECSLITTISPATPTDSSSHRRNLTKQPESIVWDKIKLSPYTNQVGGHKAFLRLTENTVCKPLQPSELRFYETLPNDLRLFVPMYLGIIHRSNGSIKYKGIYGNIIEKLVRMDSNIHSFPGRIHDATALSESFGHAKRNLSLTDLFTAFTMQEKSSRETSPTPGDKGKGPEEVFQLDEDTSLPPSKLPVLPFPEDPPKLQQLPSPKASSHTPNPSNLSDPIDIPSRDSLSSDSPKDNTPVPYINPWSLQQQNIAHLCDDYILLEDLTAYLQHPCILDLKMGTRQHGINSTAEKRVSQQHKVEASTSSNLGIRLCGMQVYKEQTNRYYFQDKYFGRSIKTREQLYDSFKSFLPKSLTLQIPKLIERLKKLSKVIEQLEGFRFYASSLLLVYDGSLTEPDADQEIEITVRMVDFANCVTRNDLLQYLRAEHRIDQFDEEARALLMEKEGDTFEDCDTGYLRGIKTLIEMLSDLHLEYSSEEKTAGSDSQVEKFTGEIDASTSIKFARARESFNRLQ